MNSLLPKIYIALLEMFCLTQQNQGNLLQESFNYCRLLVEIYIINKSHLHMHAPKHLNTEKFSWYGSRMTEKLF